MAFTVSRRVAQSVFAGTLIFVGLSAALPAQAEVISFFNFNDHNFPSDGGTRSSTIVTNFSPNSSTEGDTVANTAPGSTINAAPDGSAPFLSLDTSAYQGLSVNFAPADSNSGFNSSQFQDSFNGTNFTRFETSAPTTSTYGLQSFEMSSITGANNSNAAARMISGGSSTTSINARNAFDNIAVSGTNVAVVEAPEPETWAMMAIGLAGLALTGWYRKRNTPQPAPAFE